MVHDRQGEFNFPLRLVLNRRVSSLGFDPETKPQNVQGVLALADQMDEEMEAPVYTGLSGCDQVNLNEPDSTGYTGSLPSPRPLICEARLLYI